MSLATYDAARREGWEWFTIMLDEFARLDIESCA
jgi:hypothetical protein